MNEGADPQPTAPRASLRRTLALYALSTLAVVLVVVWAYRLWEADLRIPLYYSIGNDNDFIMMAVKTVSEQGWLVENPRLGAPGGMDLHDFPMTDTLCWLIIKATTRVIRDPLVAFNAAFFVSFLLVNWSSLFVFRRLGFSTPVAFAAALLYTFEAYHYWRGPWHMNLSFYYGLPLAFWLALRVAAGVPLFFGRGDASGEVADEPRSTRIGRALGALGVAIVLSLSGVYYLYFSGLVLVVAALIGQFRRVSAARAVEVVLLFAVMAGSFAAQVYPYLVYRKQHGRNPEAMARSMGDVRQNSLFLTYILQPTMGHRVARLRLADREIAKLPAAKIYRTGYPARDLTWTLGEKHWNTLGFAGDAGFMILLVALLGCGSRRLAGLPYLVDLAKLNAATFMIATAGGLGEVIAYVALPEIRGYTRLAIVIAWFSLAAVAIVADVVGRWAARRPGLRAAWLVALVGLTVLGLLDQTPGDIAPDYRLERADFASDETFVNAIEQRLGPGAAVLQLPYAPSPESDLIRDFQPYSHFRLYLHSRDLRWSHGTMKGREGDRRLRELAALPTAELVPAARRAGYVGITVNRKAYEAQGATLEAELKEATGVDPLVSDDKVLSFFPLDPVPAPAPPR